MNVELALEYDTSELPLLVPIVPVDDKAVKAMKLVSSILEEESPACSVNTISLHWQSVVVVELPLHSDYILVSVIGKHDVPNFVLNEDLGQQRDSSPKE